MTTKEIVIKYWKDGSILVEENNWDCFLRNEWLNPLINWLNLYHEKIESGVPCNGNDKTNDVIYISVDGNLMIRTYRDVVFLSKEGREKFVQWLNDHRDMLHTREVVI